MKILGIEFQNERVHRLVQLALKGGLVVVPSGPGLAQDLRRSAGYREAMLSADIAIPDSGAMVLFYKLLRGRSVRRISGLNFLESLLQRQELKTAGEVFWVHPTEEQRFRNEGWLRKQGFEIQNKHSYVAPIYANDSLEDNDLWKQLEIVSPSVIVISIGGGVQERLGFWLKKKYQAKQLPIPAIVCTGAAIGFLSGNQVKIPVWADRLYLGWFFRCLTEPSKFIPRYLSAIPLAYLVLRYGSKMPLLK